MLLVIDSNEYILAFIAAYAEWVGADILVTENRHFLTLHIDLPFRILPAKKCLKLLKVSK